MNDKAILSKVPAVTLGFWIIKILATTLGETGGDTVTMTMDLGYLVGTAIFLSLLLVLVVSQIAAKKFYPLLYWATIIASTTAGTTMADFADRSLGIGYTGGSALLLLCVLIILAAWYWSEGTVSVDTVNTPKVEAFYWATITFSQLAGGRPQTSALRISIRGWSLSARVTAAENPSRSTASAPPAGTWLASAARMMSEPSRRISACNRPTALLAASSERNELEQTSSARPSVRCASVMR